MKSTAGGSPILIIDDVDASRAELVRLVESLGHSVISTSSPFEGLRLVQKESPSLVLLDLVMPAFDGFKIAAAIKASPRFVPVMLLTGLDDLESKRRGQLAGADEFLTKPLHPVELQIRIAAMLRIKTLTDALDDANRRLAELADTDPLTGIANRRRFETLFIAEYERSGRYHRPLSYLMVDIDHFKLVNDTHGHPVGDRVLRAVADGLVETLRQSDQMGRVGGEEFAIIAPEVSTSGALALGERLRRRIEQLELPVEDYILRVTISVGAVAWDGVASVDMGAIVKRADDALYQAKRNGRNRVTLATARETTTSEMPALKLPSSLLPEMPAVKK